MHVDVSQNHRMSELEAAWLRLQLARPRRRQRAPAGDRPALPRGGAARSRWHADHRRPRRPPVRRAGRPTATASAPPLADAGVATGVHYPLALTQQPAYRQFAPTAVPGRRGVGGRVRVAAVLPRADRRRGGDGRSSRSRRAIRAMDPATGDLRNPTGPRSLGVLPLLQRRARRSRRWSATSARALRRQRRRLRDHRRRRRLDRRLARRADAPGRRGAPSCAIVAPRDQPRLRRRAASPASPPRPRSGSSTPTATRSTTPRARLAASTPSAPTSTSSRAARSAAATRGTAW